ncbi:LON peptidase substrate-binding domain-containing protein [Saccharopolyspora sp. HNM0983]|uniref:LON peptidase substrate-binding domain-containing protein n=1 Tax=Saccharopolyspora montiporae TaxID=2781240 RepID=A0A929B6Q7_9PSEU|nr:LON peptidase substrate-binding domain-containing protein [Saccharopolyspora sp. HNM0983]MBE9374237.1 LON peptidase substrate-binding domain-containing protein [Saccharopolyspora sp. HNM0983]
MDTLALFPLGSVLLPGGDLPLHIFEPRYRRLIDDLANEVLPDRTFGVVGIRQGWEVGDDNVDSMYDVGCTAELGQVRQLPAGRFDVNATGGQRFRLLQIDSTSAPYLMARVEPLPDDPPPDDGPQRRARLVDAARAAHRRYHETGLRGGATEFAEDTDPADLAYRLADDSVLTVEDRQSLLAETDPLARLRSVRGLLLREAEFLRELRAVPAPLTEFAHETSTN